jgi:two-component system, NarL family, nitrate/nitrite response regulator NarL
MNLIPARREGPVRIVFVADVRLYVCGLAAVVPPEKVQIVGTADCRDNAPTVVHALEPDAVLVDVMMPEALELIRQLRVDPPPVHVIAFGVSDAIPMIVACAEAGAAAYVAASATVEELVATVQGAVAGELRCPPRVAGELFRLAATRLTPAADAGEPRDQLVLTGRQRQVLALLRQSLSNKEIGKELNISEATVKNHVHRLLDKLHVPNRARAARCLPTPNQLIARSRSSPRLIQLRESGT